MQLSNELLCSVVRFGPIFMLVAAPSIAFWSVWAYDKIFGDENFIINIQQARQTCRHYAMTVTVSFVVMLIGLIGVAIVGRDFCV